MEQFYRNTRDITSIEGIEVDNGSLWRLDESQNLLVLEDEDQYVSHKFSAEDFKEAL